MHHAHFQLGDFPLAAAAQTCCSPGRSGMHLRNSSSLLCSQEYQIPMKNETNEKHEMNLISGFKI